MAVITCGYMVTMTDLCQESTDYPGPIQSQISHHQPKDLHDFVVFKQGGDFISVSSDFPRNSQSLFFFHLVLVSTHGREHSHRENETVPFHLGADPPPLLQRPSGGCSMAS